MFVNGVQDEDFYIIGASACAVSKLKWIHQGVSCSHNVLFYDLLHGFHHQGGEGHRAKIIQGLWVVSFGNRNDCGMFPQLGNSMTVN